MSDLTDQQELDLESARHLAEHGVPVFVAKPNDSPLGYRLPRGWQRTKPDPSVVDQWRPGMALCMVTGVLVDVIDIDPRNGGDRAALNGTMPRTYGEAASPSGGSHDLIATLGVRTGEPFAGVDLKAGDTDGEGRGFIFIAPTERPSKVDGEIRPYRWVVPPDLAGLALVGGDDSGAALREVVLAGHRAEYTGPAYDGPAYAGLDPGQQAWADRIVADTAEKWRALFARAQDWPEGEADAAGRGWEALSRDWAWACARMAVTPWIGLDEAAARALHDEVLPEAFAADGKCAGKWRPSLLAKAASKAVERPPWEDFVGVLDSGQAESWPDVPKRLDDAHMAAWMAYKGLAGRWCWAGGLGWMEWDDRRWVPRRDEDTREAIRKVVIDVNQKALSAGASADAMKAYNALLSSGRIGALSSLMRGVVSVDGGGFDQQRDLLNCANGVVDLRTAELLPHDPKYLLTKITETAYVRGAEHPDWAKALDALDPEVTDWMQVRFGQAATGYPTSDDILPIGQGGGSNGKSTILAALFVALGPHMVQVPEKLLRAGPNDHPTELMTLMGARVAVVDETPEVAQLNVQRLKAAVGQEWMTARAIRRDNVTWRSTHSLFVMTNYTPSVRETDHGTWRRLALVRYTKTFPKDDRFRARMARGAGGRREAVLAWVVAGARRWYDNDQMMPDAPPRVVADTLAWRRESDLVLAYLAERIVFDPKACVTTGDLLDDMNQWLFTHGHKQWSDKLLSSRFGQHEEVVRRNVSKSNPRVAVGLVRLDTATGGPNRPNVWLGIRWRTAKDD